MWSFRASFSPGRKVINEYGLPPRAPAKKTQRIDSRNSRISNTVIPVKEETISEEKNESDEE
ncbi:unnamed protein product [Meloidogyne enterolobii]|uniref:Uncharacterized protein n=1 Tax=Meloidogyne enterolobii TaxID=390850 RepID=A0ACB1AS54_MELEN